MESRTIQSQMSGIENLPAEVLDCILQQCSTRDLLYYRLVSTNWNQVVTPLCRRRHVTLSCLVTTCGDHVISIFDDLLNTTNLPWAAFVARASQPFDDLIKRSFKIPGPNLRRLQFEPNSNWDIIYTLKHTINLTTLIISTDKFTLPPTCGVKLPYLKWLEIGSENLSLLQYLLDHGSQLQHLQLQDFQAEDRLLQYIDALARVPAIVLKTENVVPMSTFGILNSRKLNVTQLKISIVEPSKDSPNDYYSPLEKFLADMINLQELDMYCVLKWAGSNIVFKYPWFQSLERFELSFDNAYLVELLLKNMESYKFPKLKSLKIDAPYIDEFFKSSVTFESVTELDVCDGCDKWNEIFPNLKKLNIISYSMEVLENVFLNTRLEDLKLEISISRKYHEYMDTVNYFLFGTDYTPKGSDDEEEFPSQEEEKGIEILPFTEPYYEKPKLISLRALKMLEISFDVDCDHPTLYTHPLNFLLRMQPLDRLTIRDLEISGNCQRRLKKYHKEFVHINNCKAT